MIKRKAFFWIESRILREVGDATRARHLSAEHYHMSDVNPELAEEIGKRIFDDMTGKALSEVSFTKDKQVKSMQAVQSLNLKGETFVIEAELLFQRLLLCAQTSGVNLHERFSVM